VWNKAALAAAGLVGTVLACASAVEAQTPLQEALVVERLGSPIPASLTFADEQGRDVRLGSLMSGKPVVLMLAYFTCPMLCRLGQDGAADAFRDSGWRLGDDFRAITVSIDPRDRPAGAREWHERVAARLGVRESTDWHFLVGDAAAIRQLADAVGFRYAYDAATQQYSHAACVFVIGADGRVSQYVYGITFEPSQIAAALSAASANRQVTSAETFLMRCFHYVPALRQHGGFVVWLLRLGGIAVTAVAGSTLALLWRRETRA
jgi:protein SCO1/2